MPYGKRKRFYRKKRGKKNQKAIVPRRKASPYVGYSLPFPSTRKIAFKYSEYGNMTDPGPNTISNYSFRLSSLYDPNLTGVGDQPRYFDQVVGERLYRKYQVDAVKWKVTFINKSSSAGDAQCAVRFVQNTDFPDAADCEGLFLLSEQSRTIHRTLLPTGDDKARVVLTGTQPLWPILARSKAEYKTNTDVYGASWDANPARGAIMFIYGGDNPQDALSHDIDWYVELTYLTIVYERADSIAQS